MKKVVFSFDDSRSDFYTRAYPVLLNYNFPSTLNVITGFVNGDKSICFPTSSRAISREELLICYQYGLVEIACHGSKHINTRSDIEKNIEELNSIGVDTKNIGFASPNSVLTLDNKNKNGIWGLVENGTLKYVRTGIQIRREGLFYIIGSIISRFLHIPSIFCLLNKRNIIPFDNKNIKLLPSVSIYSYTTVKEIDCLIDRMPDNSTVILMFHSILNNTDIEYGKDKYYWDIEKFKSLCEHLKNRNVEVCTTMNVVENNS